MRLLALFLVALLASVGLALIVRHDPGYLMAAYGPWTVESTLAVFALVATMAFSILYWLVRALLRLWNLPAYLGEQQRKWHSRRTRQALTHGLIALAEGQWKRAEDMLVRCAPAGDTPLINYLGAARAAQHLGAYGRSDHYLQKAHESMPAADVAVGLTQAELQLARGQLEQALATLKHLRRIAPQHRYVLKLLRKLYSRLKDWEQLRVLLPQLRRYHVIPEKEQQALGSQVFRELLRSAARQNNTERVRKVWAQVPRPLQGDAEVLPEYVRHLVAIDAQGEAEALVRAALSSQWHESLAYLYGFLEGEDPAKQLGGAEQWLAEHTRSADLLLTLGRLCLRNRLWGKARSYLEASIGAEPRPETYQELGALLERMNAVPEAMACYRKGIELAAPKPPGAKDTEGTGIGQAMIGGTLRTQPGTALYPPASLPRVG